MHRGEEGKKVKQNEDNVSQAHKSDHNTFHRPSITTDTELCTCNFKKIQK